MRSIDGVAQTLFGEFGAMTAPEKLGVQMADVPAGIFLSVGQPVLQTDTREGRWLPRSWYNL